MTENKFDQIFYLCCKSLINADSFLSHPEIFREVRNSMIKMFGEDENLMKVLIYGRLEDFNDVLDFCLAVLRELGICLQKEDKSNFYFKWQGVKGFTAKYLSANGVVHQSQNDDDLLNFESRIENFTRKVLTYLIMRRGAMIGIDQLESIISECLLKGYENHANKIISILLFIDFLVKYEGKLLLNTNFFNYSAAPLNDPQNIVGEIESRPLYTEPEKFTNLHNILILEKVSLWTHLIEVTKNTSKQPQIKVNKCATKKPHFIKEEVGQFKEEKKAEVETQADTLYCSNDKLRESISESGFALIKGTDWSFYMKEFMCIIGRAADKHAVRGFSTEKNLSKPNWELDIDLGQHKRISRQHALIAYNFEDSCFEIKNISRRFPLKVNGELVKPQEEMPLSSKSSIMIGNQEFYFLLPKEQRAD